MSSLRWVPRLRPTTKTAWKRAVLRLNRDIETKGGYKFYRGELVVVRHVYPDGTLNLGRYSNAGVNLDQNDDSFQVIGERQDIFR